MTSVLIVISEGANIALRIKSLGYVSVITCRNLGIRLTQQLGTPHEK